MLFWFGIWGIGCLTAFLGQWLRVGFWSCCGTVQLRINSRHEMLHEAKWSSIEVLLAEPDMCSKQQLWKQAQAATSRRPRIRSSERTTHQ